MKRIFTNGCFDGLHAGHIHLLIEARKLGDFLIVAVNGDESVREIKGQGHPLISLWDRSLMLYQIKCIDAVIPFFDPSPEKLIRNIKPDIIVKGADWKDTPRLWDDICPTVFIDLLPGFSSSNFKK